MQRRKALATAGAITLTAATATLALGANLGLFGLGTPDTGVGNFVPVDATEPVTSTPSFDDDTTRSSNVEHDDDRDDGDEHERDGDEHEDDD
jgi:hypothetical protein